MSICCNVIGWLVHQNIVIGQFPKPTHTVDSELLTTVEVLAVMEQLHSDDALNIPQPLSLLVFVCVLQVQTA